MGDGDSGSGGGGLLESFASRDADFGLLLYQSWTAKSMIETAE